MARKNGRGMKHKGDGYEREVAAHIAAVTGLPCARAPLSGGGVIGQFHGGADINGTPGLHVETKRAERLRPHEWMRQAEKAIEATGAPEVPVIVTRQNRQPTDDSLVVLRLSSFLPIYQGWLREQGYVK